ncbi:LytR C-terminal domain-containing protein [Nocardioides dubius]|uniref:LytR/CpsA/Psr regulator C-terminal domain-containing protein n=1 Tax=Nocardioides dubius TaxID=317019 RepID=A0ABN1TUB2_9ACTN
MDHKRTTITLSALVLLCLFGLFFGLRAVTAELPGEGILNESAPTCTNRVVSAGSTITSEEITVSVYNGGGRSGLASRTMQEFVERGFSAGDSGNARDTGVKVAQVWADSKDNPAAQLVLRQLGKGFKIHTGKPALGVGVVVVLGSDFEQLAKSAPSRIEVTEDATICSPPL